MARQERSSMHGRKIRICIALTTTVLSVSALAGASEASADTVAVQRVYATGGEGLYAHPSDPTVDSPTYGYAMPDGTEFDISCWAPGDDVNGDSVWDYGTDAATGDTGYAADYYIDTNVTQGNEGAQLTAQGVPQCGTGTNSSTDTGSSTDTPADQLDTYNRSAAVQWALDHAQDPQIEGAECTYFVSEALWAGGLARTSDWSDQGSYGRAPGTATAWQVEPMLDLLQSTYNTTWENITGDLSTNAVPDAQPGDIIVYDWDSDGTLDHMSLVTDIASGDYPDVAEMGQFNWTTHPWYYAAHPASSYVTRGWTYSEQNHEWLQSENGHADMQAYLLHFNGGVLTGSF